MQWRTGRLQERGGTDCTSRTAASHAGSFRCKYRTNSMRTGNGAKRNGTSQIHTFFARTRAWSNIHTKTQITRPYRLLTIQNVVCIFRLLVVSDGISTRETMKKIAKAASNPITTRLLHTYMSASLFRFDASRRGGRARRKR